jgi:diguanylate cyclase (GGDEF)-like protein
MRQSHASNPYYKWNRKILNVYWLIGLLTVTAEVVGIFFRDTSLFHYLINFLIIPSILIAAVVGLAEWVNRRLTRFVNTYTLAAGTFIAAVLVKVNNTLEGLQYIFLIPLLVSALYFQKRKVLLSFTLNVVTFLLIDLTDPTMYQRISAMEAIVTITAYIGGYMVVIGIMSRGMEMQRDLIATIEKQQDLMVRSAMMEWLSKTDALTDLYNHKTFHEYLDKLVEQSEQYGLPLQLAVFDIDNFKKINDTYGHWIGDIILRRVAAAIKGSVSPDDIVSRFGGEEFAVIFTDKRTEEAYRLCELIRHTIADDVHEELNGGRITISIGLQPYILGRGKEHLFKGADGALYRAKRTGKNRTLTGDVPVEEPTSAPTAVDKDEA